jgi:hypothetical protein
VYRRLGFFRDPFAPDPDPALYLETPGRRGLRSEAETALASGGGLWIEGSPGAGKSAFAHHLAAKLAEAGRPVLFAPGGPSLGARDYLETLYRAAVGEDVPADPERLAEALYARILRVFWKRGTVVVWVAEGALGEGALREAEALVHLRVKGRPLALPILCGSGPPPFPGLATVALSPLSREDLAGCLLHRALLCGNREGLPLPAVEAAAGAAAGIGDALRRARAAMLRLIFPGEEGAASESAPPPPPIFDAGEVGEVGRLLAAISSGSDDD